MEALNKIGTSNQATQLTLVLQHLLLAQKTLSETTLSNNKHFLGLILQKIIEFLQLQIDHQRV